MIDTSAPAKVVATAGHVDHGKSTLVKAITGTDPDRLDEEKARGLTIDLGFAWARLPGGSVVSFIDVPGHVRFIGNMLAGVGSVDSCLFVVDAHEGWKPQSEEHLRILDLLGFRSGVVAVTKCDLAGEEQAELAAVDVADHLAGTFLADAPVVTVDAVSGWGMDVLVGAIEDVVARSGSAPDADRPRMWVDRSFAARGAGTVVTGTLTGGRLRRGDELVVEPSGALVRVRSLQTHNAALDVVAPGRRAAVNLTGVERREVSRGAAIVRSGEWHRAARFDARLEVLPSLNHDVSRRGAFQVYVFSAELPVSVRVIGAKPLRPGESGFVRIHLPHPLPLTPGDRFVMRESGRAETVGGGVVLDVDPLLPASRARPSLSTDRVVDERGWTTTDELYRLTGERREPEVGRWVVSPAALARAQADLENRIQNAEGGVDLAVLSDRERAVVAAMQSLATTSGRVLPKNAASPESRLVGHPYVKALEQAPFDPPPPSGVARADLRGLVEAGLVVERDGIYFAASAVHEAVRRLASLLTASEEGFTVAAARDALGSTRKHVLPLLAHLDATGVTRRRGDLRIAGPRFPRG